MISSGIGYNLVMAQVISQNYCSKLLLIHKPMVKLKVDFEISTIN